MNRQIAYLWGGVVVALVVFSPWAAVLADGMWPCTFKSLTGYACPTCGTTRAALLLSRLEIADALALYPLPALAWIGFLVGGLGALGSSLAGRTPPRIPNRLPVWARVAVVTAVLLNWAYSIATGV